MFGKIRKMLNRKNAALCDNENEIVFEDLKHLKEESVGGVHLPGGPHSPYKYLFVLIWEDITTMPGENDYVLIKEEIDTDNDIIRLFFENKKECIIERPSGIVLNSKEFKIHKAKKIVFKYYSSGKPQTPETLNTEEYTLLDDSKVRVIFDGWWVRDEIIDVSGKLAFDSHVDPSIVKHK